MCIYVNVYPLSRGASFLPHVTHTKDLAPLHISLHYKLRFFVFHYRQPLNTPCAPASLDYLQLKYLRGAHILLKVLQSKELKVQHHYVQSTVTQASVHLVFCRLSVHSADECSSHLPKPPSKSLNTLAKCLSLVQTCKTRGYTMIRILLRRQCGTINTNYKQKWGIKIRGKWFISYCIFSLKVFATLEKSTILIPSLSLRKENTHILFTGHPDAI